MSYFAEQSPCDPAVGKNLNIVMAQRRSKAGHAYLLCSLTDRTVSLHVYTRGIRVADVFGAESL